MLLQHHATMLDQTCSPRLNTMLDDVGRSWLELTLLKISSNIVQHCCAGFVGTGLKMDLSPLRQNFEKYRNRQKYHHSLKEHPTFTKIAKFGCEML